MYELAKPSQLRAAPPLRDAGLPGVHMIVLGPNGSDHYRKSDRRIMAGAGKNTRCTVSAFTHTYYGQNLQDISASLRHGGHLVRPPPHLVHRRNQGRGRCGFGGRRQSHAVHGKLFYTRVLWAILTGYVGWFAARPPRTATAAAAWSRRSWSVEGHGSWPVQFSRATAKTRGSW